MARIRSIKPELRRSLTVASWPREVRYAWVLLWGYLDDEGRGLDDMRLLVADLFPLDRDVTEKKLDQWLSLMAGTPDAAGISPLCRYVANDRPLLHATKWTHQKVSHPYASKLPACLTHSGIKPEPIRNQTGADPESFETSRTPADQGSGNSTPTVLAPDGAEQSISQRAQALAKAFIEVEPLASFEAVMGVAKKAINAGRYTDEQIRSALLRLAADGRPVTAAALKIELDGPATRTLSAQPTPPYLERFVPEPERPKANPEVVAAALAEARAVATRVRTAT